MPFSPDNLVPTRTVCSSTNNVVSPITTTVPHEKSSSSTVSPRSTFPSKSPSSIVDRSAESGSVMTPRRLGADFTTNDICVLSELGKGNGGVVSKVQLKATGFLMVKKTFDLDIKTSLRAQILRDLQLLYECSSPFITKFLGAFHVNKSLSICTEYMDAGGLDTLLPMVGRFPEPIVVQIAAAVVNGLQYLWEQLHIIHRNLKPSNVMVNRSGGVKLCDFVVSIPLANALASAFVSMRTYVAPERLAGEPLTPNSDIWSLGLTLMELAIGCYPFPSFDPVDFVRSFAPEVESNMDEHWKAAKLGEPLPALEVSHGDPISMFELFACVVEHPSPRLPAYCFSPGFIQLVHACLQKDPTDRLSCQIIRDHIIPPLLLSSQHKTFSDQLIKPCAAEWDLLSSSPSSDNQDYSSPSVSIAGYLRGIFARQQAEAIDAVVLAVGEDLDTGDTSFCSNISSSFSLPSTSQLPSSVA